MKRAVTFASLALLAPTFGAAQAGAAQASVSPPRSESAEVYRLTITKPTVIAFLVVPDGAVDTLPDLAVTADDWNYSMALLGDSLRAHNIEHVIVTRPRLRITSRGAAPVTLSLGTTGAGGYVFVSPGERPCLRREGADIDSVLSAARLFFAPRTSASTRPRARSICR